MIEGDKIKSIATIFLPRLFLALFIAGGAVLFAIPLAAQEAPTGSKASLASGDTTPKLALAEVEAALTAIEADTTIKDAEKNLLRLKYKQSIEALKEASNFAALAEEYREALKTAPAKSAELRSQLKAQTPVERAAEVIPSEGLNDLQQKIDLKRADLSRLKDDLSKISSELVRLKERPFQISSRLPATQQEMSDISKQLTSPTPAGDEKSPSRIADHILLQATQSRLQSEADMLHQEQLSQSVREDLLFVQNELLQSQVEHTQAVLASLEDLQQQRLTGEAKQVGTLAETMPEDLPAGDETARALASEVQALAREFEDVIQEINNVKKVQDDVISRRERLNEQYESAREELEISSGGRGMAQILLDMQRRFPDRRAYVKRLATQVTPVEEARLAGFQVNTKLRKQPEVESQFSGHPSDAVKSLINTRREVLEKLRTQYGNLTRVLASLEGDKRQYLGKAEEVRAYASEQLFGFGMRSATPIDFKTVASLPDALRWLFRSDHWVEFGRILKDTASRKPVLSIGIMLFIAALLFFRRWLDAALKRSGALVQRASTDRYAYTGEALFWTILLAVPIPLLIGFTAWALQQTPEASAWTQGIADGLQRVGLMTFVLIFLAAVCRRDGLGVNHFRWQEKVLARFRRALLWFAVVYIPALLIIFSSLYEDTSAYLFGAGRFIFMLAHVWAAIILWQVFHFSDGILARFITKYPNHIIVRWRYPCFALLPAFPIALAVIAGMGYMITALQLSTELAGSAYLIAVGVIFYWLTRRWFRVKQRKLAMEEAIEKRRAQQGAAASQGQQSGDVISVDPEEEQRLNLVSVSEQTQDLLRSLFSLGVAIAIFYFWSDSFPVITTFDAIPIPLTGGLTLLGLARAVLIVVVTYIAVRNLPGLLELAVLRATSIDAGTRNAISTLCQYALIAIGISLLFNVLKVDWAKLGWIAAALSVGIGFGLQEVVANFVCGIIVLFERPIRVGDVVTVGGMTGTVTKIRIRATTITNGERQDFVVPNKTLITGSLLNWTLNTAVNRITIQLGVASGTDTDKARQILLEIAANHPAVLDDPAPMATFERFGDSSLNLVLYAFLPDLNNRMQTVNDLHTQINKRFTAAGIEIPNPQFDVRHLNGKEQ